MRFKLISAALLLVSCLLPACKGTQGDSKEVASQPFNKSHLTECKCGTPEADIFGCTATCCVGEACSNVLCTCEKKGQQPSTRPAIQKMDGTGYTGPGSTPAFSSQARYEAYMTTSGKILKGTPIKREGDRIRFRMPISGGGSVEALKPLSSFAAHSAYNILRKLEPGHDLKSHVALAKFALENGLISTTQRELRYAAKYAKEAGKLDEFEEKVKEGAARILKGLVRKAMAEGDLKKAHRFGNLLFTRLPEQMTEAEKEAMLSAYEKAKAEQDQAKRAKKEARVAADRSKVEQRILKPIEEKIAKGEKRNHKGLVGTSNQSTSLKAFVSSAKDFKWAMKRISTEQRKASNRSKVLGNELGGLERRAKAGYIEANLNAGSINLGRSSLNKARKNVNAILAVDPKNSRAQSMRARIEIAGNQGWGFGWGGAGRVGR